MIEKAFNNKELGIEFKSYIDEECCVWFKAKQVAQILGYRDTDQAIRKHISENHKRKFNLSQPVDSTDQVQGRWIIFVDEAGFYELVFRSRLPAAKIFREWVFTTVLPSIRKYGYFNMFKSKRKKRVIIDGVKFYKHDVFVNYAASKDGVVMNLKNKKIMTMSKNNSGYLSFSIYNKNFKKTKSYFQHRFVYEVFNGKIPPHLEIDHINGDKTDNQKINLQLLTHQQNIEKSSGKPIISISIETGEKKRFDSIKKASIELDINKATISNTCCKRKSFKTAKSKKDRCKYTFKFLDWFQYYLNIEPGFLELVFRSKLETAKIFS